MMNKKDEALKMAIKTIESTKLGDAAYGLAPSIILDDTINACKEALEQSSRGQWTCGDVNVTNCQNDTLEQFCRDNIRLAPFFAMLAEALKQPAQEPSLFGWYDNHDIHNEWQSEESIPLYTHPHQDGTSPSKWTALTDDEIVNKWNEHFVGNTLKGIEFARAIEQELKTKNGFSDIKEKNNG